MSRPEIDTVVNDFRQAQSTHDYSHAVFDLGQLQRRDGMNWQKDATEINNTLKQLGFNDFQIVGTDDKGPLLTTSGDGKQFQARDPIHLNVQDTRANEAQTQHWGNRDFSVNTDGSAHYEVKRNDTYWSVVKDALSARLGHDASNTEVANTLRDLANAQGRQLKDLNTLHPGDSIDIPMPKPAGDGGYQVQKPGTTNDTSGLNAMNPPGTNGHFNKDRTQTTTEMDRETGMSTKTSKGELDDSVLNGLTFGLAGHGTKFESTQVTGRDGALYSRDTKYEAGVSLMVQDESGTSRQIDNVGEVQTRFNNNSGQYETTITSKDGRTVVNVNSDKNGKTLSMDPKPAEWIPPVAMM